FAASPCIFQLPATSGLIAVTVLPPLPRGSTLAGKPLCSLENGALPPYVLLPMMPAPREQSYRLTPRRDDCKQPKRRSFKRDTRNLAKRSRPRVRHDPDGHA